MSIRIDETIIKPVDTGLLPEKVMPFSEPVVVTVVSNRGTPEINVPEQEAGELEIVLVVNGVMQLKYRGSIDTPPGYRMWQKQLNNSVAQSSYECPVSTADTEHWRGLVQAYIKTIRNDSRSDVNTESAYTVVPLFIARQAPFASIVTNYTATA